MGKYQSNLRTDYKELPFNVTVYASQRLVRFENFTGLDKAKTLQTGPTYFF